MREWLMLQLSNFLRSVLGHTPQPSTDGEAGEEVLESCPICGEEWEKGEAFCYHCGYEIRDEELPLHPPPQRTGGLSDPGEYLEAVERMRLETRFASLGRDKGWDVAVFLLPEELSRRLGPNAVDEPGETLDGMAFCLYNTWQIGKDSDLKGLLLVVDPVGGDRVLVRGKKGPGIGGEVLRKWYGDLQPERGLSVRSSAALASELDHVADRLAELPQ